MGGARERASELGERGVAPGLPSLLRLSGAREREEKREKARRRGRAIYRVSLRNQRLVFFCRRIGEESGARARYREPEPTNPSSEPAGWTLTRTPWGRTTAPPADSRAPTRARPSTSS